MQANRPFIDALNEREQKILSLIEDGWSYGEIGKELYIEKVTVTWYVQQIYDKLGLEKGQRNHRRAISNARAMALLGNGPGDDPSRSIQLHLKNPYKGLRPFQQGDAGDFFGREA